MKEEKRNRMQELLQRAKRFPVAAPAVRLITALTVLLAVHLAVCLTGRLTCIKAEASVQMADGEYAVEVSMTGGSGKASIETPTLLTVENGVCYARITWSSSNYDYMLVDGQKYLNQSGEGENSVFVIPVPELDTDMSVIADTLAMGTPHEIEYVMHFYSESLGSKSSLPQEGAKRVLVMAALIIVGGGILNHFVKKRAQQDYTGSRSRSGVGGRTHSKMDV